MMKINNPSEIQPNNGANSGKSRTEALDGGKDFASVLKETTQKAQNGTMPANVPSQPLHPTLTDIQIKQGPQPESSAARLLDAMEKYQHTLADPSANLRQVQAMVEQMKAVADKAAAIGEAMPDGHAVKAVINEALVQVGKEMVRFERGEYVDG